MLFSNGEIVCKDCGREIGSLITWEVVADCLQASLEHDEEFGNYPGPEEIRAVRKDGDLPQNWRWGEAYIFPVFYRCPGCDRLDHVAISVPWVVDLGKVTNRKK